MMRTLTASLAGLLILAVAPPVPAQQDPSGCSGASMIFNLFVERADGSNAGAAVSPCETLIYQGTLTGGSTGNCCFQGGTVTITTPDGVAHDVTPLGGGPKKCPGDALADTLAVQYQVRSQDIVNGGGRAPRAFPRARALPRPPPPPRG